jgi:hypothetical protein
MTCKKNVTSRTDMCRRTEVRARAVEKVEGREGEAMGKGM